MPRHCVVLHGASVKTILKLAQINTGLILVDKDSKESRQNAKLDMIKRKLTEYEEVISTMRFKLMEEKGVFSKKTISNQEYINFLKGNFHNLKLGGIDLDLKGHIYWEQMTIFTCFII